MTDLLLLPPSDDLRRDRLPLLDTLWTQNPLIHR